MEDFFGLPVGETTFIHRADNFISSIEDIFPEENSLINCSEHGSPLNYIQFYPLGGCRILLSLKHPISLYFRGALGVKCIAGQVEIDGHTLKPEDNKSCAVYSLGSHSALCFSTCNSKVKVNDELLSILDSLDVLTDLKDDLLVQDSLSCLLLLWKHDFVGSDKIESDIKGLLQPYSRFYEGITYFAEAEEYLNCIFDISSGNRIRGKMVYNEDFKFFSTRLVAYKLAPKIAVCGGKGVGKSTSLRYLVNKLLSVWEKILFIDFDIGQPEFTVPGCVYVHIVKKPLLGPNYTHIRQPLKSIFLGHINADYCFDEYLEAVKELHDFCFNSSDLSSIPWVINTMGYVKGCGLLLLKSIVSTFKLSHVIQLNNPSNPKLNMEHPLSPQNVSNTLRLKYVLETFTMLPSAVPKSAVSPRMSRDLMVCFYLISDLRLQTIFLSSNPSAETNEVMFESFLPHDSLYPDEILAVCSLELVGRFKNCLGFGRVIAYSENDRQLTLLTPLPESVFSDCCIIRGNIDIHNDYLKESISSKFPRPQKNVKIFLGAGAKSKCPPLFSIS